MKRFTAFCGAMMVVGLTASIASADTFFSGLIDVRGSVAGGVNVIDANQVGLASGGISYNNTWTGKTGGIATIGNLVSAIGVIPIVSAQTSAGTTNLGTGNRFVAVYSAQGVHIATPGGAPGSISVSFDPTTSVTAANAPAGAVPGQSIPSRGLINIYDRGAITGADSILNLADPRTWVPDFNNLNTGLVGQLAIDERALDGYFAGLPLSQTAIFAITNQAAINTGPVDTTGAFTGLRVDLKAVFNALLVGNPGNLFANPDTIPNPAVPPPGPNAWQKLASTWGAYGSDDLLIRLEQVALLNGFANPNAAGLADLETLFNFLLDQHPNAVAPFADGLFHFQNILAANGDQFINNPLGFIAGTGDLAINNTGGQAIPGAQFQIVGEPEPGTIAVWCVVGLIGAAAGARMKKSRIKKAA